MAASILTDTGLKKAIKDYETALVVGGKLEPVNDGGGLSLVRQSSGSWIWFYRYYKPDGSGKRSRLSLGTYPTVTLGQAREALRQAKEILTGGTDPAAHRDEQKAAARLEAENSFKAVALQWWDNWRTGKEIDEHHAQSTIRRLENDVFPAIGKLTINSIHLRQLSPMLKAIEQRAPSLAEKSWVACGQVFRYACAHGIMENNPLANVKRGDLLNGTQRVENQKRVSPQEIPALLRAIDGYDGVLARLGLQLMALVFVRHSELRGARWSDFDFEKNLWTIPAKERNENGVSSYGMKRVKGNPTPHIVPLSRQALAILKQLHSINGGREHLFPSVKGDGKVMSDGTLNKALDALGYKDRHTVHGFRGMASTALHEMDFPHEHIEIQLAHLERNKVSAAYNHAKYIPQRTTMMQAWADYLDEQRGQGKIIKLHA